MMWKFGNSMELSPIFLIFSMGEGKNVSLFADDFLGAAINYVAARKRIFPVPAEPSFSILRYELIKGTQEDTLEVMVKRVTWKISGETSFQSSFISLFLAPLDAHNKYSIKTFLSKHSSSRSIQKNSQAPTFFF